MGISTHILDTSVGRPAPDVAVTLERRDGDAWVRIGAGHTDADGRCRTLLLESPAPGTYRLGFEVGAWFAARSVSAFFPEVSIVFVVARAGEHFHVPLLLTPFSYSTYRGS